MVHEAQSSKVLIQALANRSTGVFVPTDILVALLTFASWMLFPVFFGGIASWPGGIHPRVSPLSPYWTRQRSSLSPVAAPWG
jgi:Cu+-exporting ATPase